MRKSVVLVAVMLVLALGVAWAGDHSKKMTSAEKAAKLQAKLELSDAQTEQVKAVIDEFAPRWDAIKAKHQEGVDVSADKAKLYDEQNARYKSIFSAEQWTKYEQMRAEAKKAKN